MKWTKTIATILLGMTIPSTMLVRPTQPAQVSEGQATIAHTQIASSFNPLPPYTQQQITQSLAYTQSLMELNTIKESLTVTGQNITIAVIDTGIDVAHLDLQKTDTQQPKVVDWQDFTDEGKIYLTPVQVQNYHLAIEGQPYFMGNISTGKYSYFVGNMEGKGILLVDQRNGEEILYIDADGDDDFTDEIPLTEYSKNKQYILVEDKGIVLTEIDKQKRWVKLSTDLVGHGTYVAGIIAANGVSNGAAENAQLMALKIAEKNGRADTQRLIEAIEYAIDHGADVINISLSQDDDPQTRQALAPVLERANQENVIVVAAAGNEGPAEQTSLPADYPTVISVGAYYDVKMEQTDQGVWIESEGIYHYSNRAYSQENIYPTVVAPGGVVSTLPLWIHDGYGYDQGTSTACAQVSGAIALLLEGLQQKGVNYTSQQLKQAVLLGSVSIEQPQIPLFNGNAIWDMLNQSTPDVDIAIEQNQSQIKVTNGQSYGVNIQWKGSAGMSYPEKTHIDGNGTVTFPIKLNNSTEFGLLVGYINEVPQLVIPIQNRTIENQQGQRNFSLNQSIELAANQTKTYTFNIPQQVDLLTAQLSIETWTETDGQQLVHGRGKMYLVNPNGDYQEITDTIGATYQQGNNTANLSVVDPMPGLWQVIIQSDPYLSVYNLTETKGELSINAHSIE